MLWGEDSLPYSIYHDTRGEAFAIVNYIISVYEANASPLRKIPRYIPKIPTFSVMCRNNRSGTCFSLFYELD